MRNLKKILALVLALVMSMSLVVTANAFSDDDAIAETYREAATVLDGLKVLQGRDDGNFDPKANITRAEVAAIIYRIVTGDVDNKQTSIYAESSKLSDVNSASWYAGYVGFANNSQYIMGYPDGTFQPLKNVTGHEALAMLLRAIGYGKNGEFTGSNWAINTAKRANALGLTANINEGMLSQPATREMVAEMAFRALQAEIVSWSLGLDYQGTGKTLGDTFKLVEFNGVVTANEYADLYGARPLSEGKTEIGDETYTYASTLEDIGENRRGWAAFNSKTVLFAADEGNTVYENAGAAVKDATKAAAAEGIDIAKATEKYVNFGGDGDVFESEYRIEYQVNFVDDDAQKDFAKNYIDVTKVNGLKADATGLKYNKVIRAEKTITSDDLAVIRGIFAAADDDTSKSDGISGDVYVGTNSAAADDVSDTMSYKKFYNEYITAVNDYAEVTSADNGEWLKVIDNNGDGEAEYVLRTDFVMTTIVDYNKKTDVYTVEYKDTEIDGYAISTEIEKLAEGDVILYTKIDGVYHITEPEVAVKSIAKKGIDYKNDTITTTDDEVFGQSGIEEEAAYFANDITDAATEVSYDLYLDHFGYVRLYTESAYNKGIALLTDGYYETNRRDDLYKAEIWDNEAAELAEVVVLDPNGARAGIFVDDEIDSGDNEKEEGTWKRLNPVDDVYDHFTWNDDGKFITNVAAFNVNDDGEYTMSAVNAKNAVSNKKAYDVVELDLASTDDVKERTYASDEVTTTSKYVQTTNDTLYYFVTTKTDKYGDTVVSSVLSWTGYKNAPKDAVLGANPVAYAVTSNGKGDYDVAEVVVFETAAANRSTLHFVYGLNAKTWDRADAAFTVGYNAETEAYESDLRPDIDQSKTSRAVYTLLDFYNIYENGYVENVDYTDSYIYAGTARVDADVNSRDYEIIDTEKQGSFEFTTTGVPTYVVTMDEDKDATIRDIYDVKAQDEDFSAGDRVIVVADKYDNVLYTINVSLSVYGKNDTQIARILELWGEIERDNNAEINAPIVTFYDAIAEAGKITTIQYTDAAKANVVLNIENGKGDLKASDITLNASNDENYTLKVLGNDGKWYTYTLVQKADASTTDLYEGDGVTKITTNPYHFDKDVTIADMMAWFDKGNASELSWVLFNNLGEVTDAKDTASVDTLSKAIVTVTDASGDSAYYFVTFDQSTTLNGDDLVDLAEMMYEDGASYKEIAITVNSKFSGMGNAVMAALIDLGATPAEIYDIWYKEFNIAPNVTAGVLKDLVTNTDEVVDGYVAFLHDNTDLMVVNDATIEGDADGAFTAKLNSADSYYVLSGLEGVATAAGLTVSDATVTYIQYNADGFVNGRLTVPLSQWASNTDGDARRNMFTLGYTYDVTYQLGDVSVTVHMIKA